MTKAHSGFRLRRLRTLGAAALAAATLAACMQTMPGSYSTAEYRADPSQVQHDLYFQPGSPNLARGESERLSAALRNLILRPNDDILVHLASTGSEVLDARRIATVRAAVSTTPARVKIFAKPGFNLVDAFPDVALVQVVRYSRVTVACPNQGSNFNDDLFQRNTLLTGCINAANIANMADEKRDLTAPDQMTGTDRFNGLAAAERYRADRIKMPAIGSISQ